MKYHRFTHVFIALVTGAIGVLVAGALGLGRDGCRGLGQIISCPTRLAGIDLYAHFVFIACPLMAGYINWGIDSRKVIADKIRSTGKPAWRQYAIVYLLGVPVVFGLWLLLIPFEFTGTSQNAGAQLGRLANRNAIAFLLFAPAAAFWLVFCMSACFIYIFAPFKRN